MKRNSFEESEVSYQTLAKFGLTHEMIERAILASASPTVMVSSGARRASESGTNTPSASMVVG